MFQKDYQFPGCENHVAVSPDLYQLLADDDAAHRAKLNRALLVWRGGFASTGLTAALDEADWPIRMLDAMPPSEDWPWKLVAAGAKVTDPAQILAALTAATGAHAQPRGNVHLTLELRRYEEKLGTVGGLEWWLARKRDLESRGGFAGTFIHTVLKTLEDACAAGSRLFIEQLSIVISKDPAAALSTLTPTLHADEYYGRRQTAIVSLLERGWSSVGGAVFVPMRSMQDLWHLRPITMQTLDEKLEGETLLCTDSGDVLLYDGMVGTDGTPNRANGIPHISPDVPGKTSRLCVLMYHKRLPDTAEPVDHGMQIAGSQ